MNRGLSLALVLIVLCSTACHKDNQIEHKTPKISEQNVDPMATEAYFTWTVDFPGKMKSVVKLSQYEDMRDAISFGDASVSNNKKFSVTATDLTKTTKYYYCYETWNPNVSFGSDVFTFTTLDDSLASVSTATVINIGCSFATIGGNVSFDGNHLVTERGVCWSTSQNPNINGNHFNSGTGLGSFDYTLTGLDNKTTYYVRAYAINCLGVNYGNEVSFTTSALFSVSSNQKVFFSPGNLQWSNDYGATHAVSSGGTAQGTWRFAEHQYDYIGYNNSNISSNYNDWIDLFGWGTSGYKSKANCYQPWSCNDFYGDYYPDGAGQGHLQGTKSDWGVYNAIRNGGNPGAWRTLTMSEWEYLFNTRENASLKYGHGCVNNINGIILLPDDWIIPVGLSFISGDSNWINIYSVSEWAQMETAGAIFLPAAGVRSGRTIEGVGGIGRYWSSTRYYVPYAFYDHLYLSSNSHGSTSLDPYYGLSVRLVQDY